MLENFIFQVILNLSPLIIIEYASADTNSKGALFSPPDIECCKFTYRHLERLCGVSHGAKLSFTSSLTSLLKT